MMEKGLLKGGIAKERNPMGRVLHDRETGSTVSAISVGETGLGSAVQELKAQHPQHHSVGGVHHTTDHVRHTTTTRGGPHGYGDNIQPGRSHGYPSPKHR